VRICRKGYTPDGKNLPYFLLLYGVCRFFSEMTRESTRDRWLFWRISDVHFHMLVMAAVGGLLLWHRLKKESLDRVGEEVPLPVLKRRHR
jgi:prolipoprotein diacylglyceryltransferase